MVRIAKYIWKRGHCCLMLFYAVVSSRAELRKWRVHVVGGFHQEVCVCECIPTFRMRWDCEWSKIIQESTNWPACLILLIINNSACLTFLNDASASGSPIRIDSSTAERPILVLEPLNWVHPQVEFLSLATTTLLQFRRVLQYDPNRPSRLGVPLAF